MSARGLLVVLALAACVAGCDDSVQFRLRLEWQRAGLAQSCPTNSDNRYTCAAIPMTCDIRVRVRIIGASNGTPYYSECFTIQTDGDACQLADMPIAARAIPNEMVRVQVIVWTEDELARVGGFTETDGCPVTTEFNIGGLPRLGENPTNEDPPDLPVPALGGEAYFAVGESPVATVTLGCPRWDTLDAASCQSNAIPIEATIRNPLTFGSVSRMGDAPLMDVRFGAPVSNGRGGVIVDLGEQFFTPALPFSPSGALVWRGTLLEPPSGTRCLRADRQGVAAPTITCFPIANAAAPIRVDGYLVGRMMVTSLLMLLSLDDVPEEGLVFGVVVDAAGNPVQGATVATSGNATVVYPANDLRTVSFTGTDTQGYFLSTNAPFNSTWSASVPGGLMGDGEARGGLVDFHISFVVIRLTGVVQPPIDAGIGGGDPDAGVDAN